MRYVAAMMMLSAAVCLADDRVDLIDARTLTGRVTAVSAAQVQIRSNGQMQTLERADVSSIELAPGVEAAGRPGKPLILTVCGGTIAADEVTLNDGTVTAVTTALGRIGLKTSAIRAIYFPPAAATAREVEKQCRELRLKADREDVLIAQREDGQYVGVSGVIKSVTAANVVFAWRGTDRTSERPTVRALLLASLGAAKAKTAGTLTATDGSVLPFESLTWAADTIELQTPDAGKLRVPRKAVAQIRFDSDRVVYLSDLKPAGVKEYGLFGRAFAHRTDKAVSGRAMSLDGQTFARGIGLHSFAELTYALDGRYRRLVSTVGIDDAARPNGSATLTFLGDGKPLGDPITLTGEEKPVIVRLDVKAVKMLTIQVGFGPDKLDVADHVDLGAARLIK